MKPVLNSDIMRTYVEKCSILMETHDDTNVEVERLKTVVKCASFLNDKSWHGRYHKLIIDLLLSMQNRTHLLPFGHLHLLHSVRLVGTKARQFEKKNYHGHRIVDFFQSSRTLPNFTRTEIIHSTEIVGSITVFTGHRYRFAFSGFVIRTSWHKKYQRN